MASLGLGWSVMRAVCSVAVLEGWSAVHGTREGGRERWEPANVCMRSVNSV